MARAGSLSIALLLLSCRSVPPTEILVIIDSDAWASLERVELRVYTVVGALPPQPDAGNDAAADAAMLDASRPDAATRDGGATDAGPIVASDAGARDGGALDAAMPATSDECGPYNDDPNALAAFADQFLVRRRWHCTRIGPFDYPYRPITLGVVPESDDATGPHVVALEALGYRSDGTVIVQRHALPFQSNVTTQFLMYLSAACASAACSQDETCADGRCVSVLVPPMCAPSTSLDAGDLRACGFDGGPSDGGPPDSGPSCICSDCPSGPIALGARCTMQCTASDMCHRCSTTALCVLRDGGTCSLGAPGAPQMTQLPTGTPCGAVTISRDCPWTGPCQDGMIGGTCHDVTPSCDATGACVDIAGGDYGCNCTRASRECYRGGTCTAPNCCTGGSCSGSCPC